MDVSSAPAAGWEQWTVEEDAMSRLGSVSARPMLPG